MNDSCYKILRTATYIEGIVLFLDFHSTKQGLAAIDRFLVTDGLKNNVDTFEQ